MKGIGLYNQNILRICARVVLLVLCTMYILIVASAALRSLSTASAGEKLVVITCLQPTKTFCICLFVFSRWETGRHNNQFSSQISSLTDYQRWILDLQYFQLVTLGDFRQKCPCLDIKKSHFWWNEITDITFTLPKFPKNVAIGFWIERFASFSEILVNFHFFAFLGIFLPFLEC